MNKRFVIASALAAAIAGPAIVGAQDPGSAPDFSTEKCYGIAKAGQNDCASTGNNSCAGTSRVNGDPNAWIFMPEGYCSRLVDGSLEPKA